MPGKRPVFDKGRKATRKIFLLALGWLFIVFGIIGLFVPIMQGILFTAIGLMLLASVSSRARLMRMRLGRRFPILRRAGVRAKRWWDRRFGRKSRKKEGGDLGPRPPLR